MDCYTAKINKLEFRCSRSSWEWYYVSDKSSSLKTREVHLRKLQCMIDYCNLKECYRKYILNYFGNNRKLNYCNNCSNCLNDDELKDFTKESQMILATVFRTREKYGIAVLTDILKGFKGPKIIKNNLDKVTTYGIMREYGSTLIKDLINSLLKEGYVDLKEGTYSMLKLNKRSYNVLKNKEKVIFKILDKQDIILDKELFESLRTWRKEKAFKENKRPYIIFSDSTLIDICNNKPNNIEKLLEIRGVGEKKIKDYGNEILEIINSF